MNILFLSRDYPPGHVGGVGTYVYEMSRLLAKIGHKVFVITESQDGPLDYIEQGVHIFRVPYTKNKLLNYARQKLPGFIERVEYSYIVSKKIQEVVLKHKIDIVESCEARAEGFLYYLFKRKPPLVIKLHTPEGIVSKLNRDPQTKDRQLLEKLEEWWICRAHRVIGLSQAIASLTRQHYQIRLKNLPIVSNPLDIEYFRPRQCLNNHKTVLYIGRLEFRKGVHVLIRAIPGILKEVPQVKFIFVGDDCGMKAYLRDTVERFNVSDSVEFLDQMPRDKLIGYYQQSSVCVVPSLWENQPYVILEAMACGKPVIASDTGGISEIIKDKVNGLLVAPGSVIDLTEIIIKVLVDRQLQEKLGDNARKFIENTYSPITVVKSSLKIYERFVKNVSILP
ncbi:MAG: glycosyltransferase family 4 protein [Candidatus Omnitrophota bacterium]